MSADLIINPAFFFTATSSFIYFALGVLLSKKTSSALFHLFSLMLASGLLFIVFGAYFIGAVQVVVYTGLVVVLSLMAFLNIKKESDSNESDEDKPTIGKFIKVGSVGVILGSVMGALSLKKYSNLHQENESAAQTTKQFATLLLENHIYSFEILGLFILISSIGVVSIIESKLRDKSND